MNNDLSFAIFDIRVSHAIEKRIFSCESVKREKISAGDMSRGGITEVGDYGKGPLIELISQRSLGELIYCGNRANTQD
jgi:hypothetical protein